jgi:hypothetical protein
MRIGGNTLKDRAPGEVTYYQQTLAEGENHNDDPYALNANALLAQDPGNARQMAIHHAHGHPAPDVL